MSLQLKLIHLTDPSADGHYPPDALIVRAVSPGTYTLSAMADDISNSCSLSRADVIACQEAMLMYIRSALTDGYVVELTGLGNLRLTAQSKICTAADTRRSGFTLRSLVRRYLVRFRPDDRLLRYVQANLTPPKATLTPPKATPAEER